MQRLEITNFGPIKGCRVEISDFMVLTGEQASGKSTIAKSIFYFQNLKEIMVDLVRRSRQKTLFQTKRFSERFVHEAKRIFIQAFGIDNRIADYGTLAFDYSNGKSVIISIEPHAEETSIEIVFDDKMVRQMEILSDMLESTENDSVREVTDFIYNDIFGCNYDTVYIPAGRSLLTMLSSQIGYLYAVMDDQQKTTIDYCTKCYLEEVLRIKDFFKMSPSLLLKKMQDEVDYDIDSSRTEYAVSLMEQILQGEYRSANGVERLLFGDGKSIQLNYSSSGQQEAVWIMNILFYHMLGRRNTYFIIEEPESHLFPGAQKLMVDFISLIKNDNNKVLITTHSPYILGSINNLLYADRISNIVDKGELGKVIPGSLWLSINDMGAYYLESGLIESIVDLEFGDIDHDVIDGISSEINETYEQMVALRERYMGGSL